MALAKKIEVKKLESIQGGMAHFYTPQSSHETMLVEIPAQSIDDLFVHHFQTDQLLVVKGSFLLVVLQNRQYNYIYLSEENHQVVTIPPGIPHSAINLNSDGCLLINAVLRHGKNHPKDYQPIKKPFDYDLDMAKTFFLPPSIFSGVN
ncbi:MAG: dTDP-4-dehydrorhamnose 3,5-epimerase [Cyanobacterium sp.]